MKSKATIRSLLLKQLDSYLFSNRKNKKQMVPIIRKAIKTLNNKNWKEDIKEYVDKGCNV